MTFSKLKIFGQNIKNFREKNNISLKELSLKSGIKIAYLKKIEQGKALGITIDHIDFLAKGLGISVYKLLKMYD